MNLYRALRDVEIEAGNILVPKVNSTFLAHPRLSINLPFSLGVLEEHAIREHQYDGRFPTRGISCTRSLLVAESYAKKNRVIVTIDSRKCIELGVKMFSVVDYVDMDLLVKPNDQEVILVWGSDGPLPPEVICAIQTI